MLAIEIIVPIEAVEGYFPRYRRSLDLPMTSMAVRRKLRQLRERAWLRSRVRSSRRDLRFCEHLAICQILLVQIVRLGVS
jgi:hypothetical protein